MSKGKRENENQDGAYSPISTTVQKAVSCLDALASLGGSAGASEIARAVRISRPGAVRLLDTLDSSGVLVRDDSVKRYTFSLRLYEWGALSIPTRRIIPILRRESVKLAHEIGRRVDVLVAEFPDVIHLEINEIMDGLVVTSPSNHREQWWRTASGRVIVALGPSDLADSLIASAQETNGPMVETIGEILGQVEQIRADGYTVAMGTYSNTIGVVVPVFDSSEYAVATLTVPAAREELTEANKGAWLAAAHVAAARASSQLGSRRRILLGV